jgi:hypothetical protein
MSGGTKINLKKWLLGAALAACAASVVSADSLELISGASTVTLPGSGGTTTYQNNNFNGWNIVITAGSSDSPSLTPYGLELTALVTCSNASGCASLAVGYSDTGFTAPVAANGFEDSYSATVSGSGSGTTTEYGFASSSNSLFATDLALGSVGPFTATGGNIAFGGPAISGTYSLTLADVFTAATGPIAFSTDASVTQTPEPSEALMLGTGLLGLFGLARRKGFNIA